MSQAYEVAFNDGNGFGIRWTDFIAWKFVFSRGPWNPRPVCIPEHARTLEFFRLVYCREQELDMKETLSSRVRDWLDVHWSIYDRHLESERKRDDSTIKLKIRLKWWRKNIKFSRIEEYHFSENFRSDGHFDFWIWISDSFCDSPENYF